VSLPKFVELVSSANTDAAVVDDDLHHAFTVLVRTDNNDLITPAELAHILRAGVSKRPPPSRNALRFLLLCNAIYACVVVLL
jgi:hypothetical protein